MASDKSDRIFEILRARGLFSDTTQKVAAGFMLRWGVDAYRAVIETHLVEEGKLAEILAEEFRLPRQMRVRGLQVDKNVFDFIPYDVALEHTVFPFELKRDGGLKIVMADPSVADRLAAIRVVAGQILEPYVGERSDIISAIQHHYPLSKQLPSLVSKSRDKGV